MHTVFIMTSSNGNIFRWPVNSPHKGQWRSFDVLFDLRLNKRLSKQWWGWWFEGSSRPLWRHCNVARSFLIINVVVSGDLLTNILQDCFIGTGTIEILYCVNEDIKHSFKFAPCNQQFSKHNFHWCLCRWSLLLFYRCYFHAYSWSAAYVRD